MLNIITSEVPIDEELKTRIEFICDFCNIKPTLESLEFSINVNEKNYENI